MDTTPLVSVIIPTHNRIQLVRRMIGCALGQHLSDLEVVVVDDGSVDGTSEVLGEHFDPRVRIVRNDSARGEAGARNRGIEAARGRWLAFADDDDLWSPYKLHLQLEAIAASDDAGWACVGAVEVDERLGLLGWAPCPAPDEEKLILARNVIPGGGSGVLADRELVVRLGGFDPDLRLGADRDMWIRLWLERPLATVQRPLVAHVLHQSSLSRRGGGRREAFERLASKHAAARVEHGVALDPSVLTAYADSLVLGGATGAGARLYAHAALRYRQPGLLAKSTAATLAPGLLHRRWRRAASAWAASIPTSWRDEAETWLAPWRTQG